MTELKCCKNKTSVEIKDVANELDLSVQAVHQYLKRKNVTPRRVRGAYRPNMFNASEVQDAYKYWRRRF